MKSVEEQLTDTIAAWELLLATLEGQAPFESASLNIMNESEIRAIKSMLKDFKRIK